MCKLVIAMIAVLTANCTHSLIYSNFCKRRYSIDVKHVNIDRCPSTVCIRYTIEACFSQYDAVKVAMHLDQVNIGEISLDENLMVVATKVTE